MDFLNNNIKTLVIIPAKGNSTRLPKKNLQKIANKTLIEHSIDYAKSSKYVDKIIVSSDSKEIENIAKINKVEFDNRPEKLLGEAEVADIYVELVNRLNISNYTHFVGLQPDHPDRQNKLDTMIEYFVKNKYMDLVTVNKEGIRNGSVRIVKFEFVLNGKMSRRVGSLMDDCTNIEHDWQLEKARNNILKGNYFESKK